MEVQWQTSLHVRHSPWLLLDRFWGLTTRDCLSMAWEHVAHVHSLDRRKGLKSKGLKSRVTILFGCMMSLCWPGILNWQKINEFQLDILTFLQPMFFCPQEVQ